MLFTNDLVYQFKELKARYFEILGVISLKENNTCELCPTFTPEQKFKFLVLSNIFYSNSASLEEFQLLAKELQKFEEIFNFKFFNSTFFKKANPELFDFKLFNPIENNYFDTIKGLLPLGMDKSITNDTSGKVDDSQTIAAITFQYIFIELALYFFQINVSMFYFFNIIILILMFWNLSRLATAINLIYALLHFLFFAILSGLLVILWGAIYIGFCILLIYGAAIPVLALYIIMLVNVDLIQRLFFIEHLNSKSKYREIKLFSCFLFLLLYFIFFTMQTFKNDESEGDISDFLEILTLDVFYLLLAKRYLWTLTFSYGTETAFDLPLSFYSSDIDKVASAAFWISYNELLALVFLLLIAIIVVISISRPAQKVDIFFYEAPTTPVYQTKKFLRYNTQKSFLKIFYINFLGHFLSIKWIYAAFGARKNFFHMPIFIYISKFWLLDIPTATEYQTRQALDPFQYINPEDPWSYWYLSYRYSELYNEILTQPGVQQYSIYGKSNPTAEDALIDQLNWGLFD